MKYTHLHVHSHYSLLDGLGKVDDLLDRAKELGMESIALTDHGVMYGAVELFIKAKEKGIKAIIGCEMYVTAGDYTSKDATAENRKRYHLILLVKDEVGYHNLMKLVSLAHLDGFYYKPRIDRKLLRKYAKGLIGLSACTEGEIPAQIIMGNYDKAKELALEYKDIFDEGGFFLEVQDHKKYPSQAIANEGIFKLAKEINLPVVATCDVHYVNKEDASAQDILLCVQTNRKVYESDRMNLMDFDLSLRSPEEVLAGFPDNPEVLSNTQLVTDQCDFKIKMGETQLPHFDVPDGKTDMAYLVELCEKGLTKKYGENITEIHRTRMDYELSVIEKCGYGSYFLIVQDFVNWARANGIVVGPGRGSAAGSFVSYLTGITNVDPIEYNLLFERFLNPERVSMPDVDMDFADDRREDVLNYVRQKYGNDHVSQIITFGTMAARAAIRDTGRALGIPYDFCNKTSQMIPMFTSIKKALEEVPEFKDHYNSSEDARKLIDSAMRLEGVIRHAGMHACGVVITKEPVTYYSPIQNITGSREGTVTQYSSSTKSSYVEKIGLLKMDFLGLKNLTIIQNTLRIVKKTKGIDIDIDTIPIDDVKTYELLQEARTTGVFQLESSGMKRYLKMLKPTVIEDIIAMVALYRPGPMDWIPDFISGKHGRKIKYVHPKLEPILKNTYGVAVYQEQVMQIARDLAGFTMGEADVLRKAMGKKIFELIKEQKIKFVEGCIANGSTKEIAEKVFSFIEPFAGYGFNRSHAACYAIIGYQTAYLKAHYPAAFMAALQTSDQDNIDRIAIEAAECHDMGIKVLAPNVNESFEDFAVITATDGTESIRFGFNAIKNVGHVIASEIVAERKRNGKFKSLGDFLERVETKDLNKKSIDALAKVGALDELGERNQIVESMEQILMFTKSVQKSKNSNQVSLFGEAILETPQVPLLEVESASKKQQLKWEKELLGLYVSGHPVKEYQAYIDKVAVSLDKLTPELVGQKIAVGGVIQKIQKILTKRQETMLFVMLEDTKGKIEVLVFPKVLERIGSVWEEERMIIAEGRLSDKDGVYKLIVDEAKELNRSEIENYLRVEATKKTYGVKDEDDNNKNDPPTPSGDSGNQQQIIDNNPATQATRKLIITLPRNATPEIIHNLSKFFNTCAIGQCKVFLHHQENKLETPFSIEHSPTLLDEIKKIVNGGNAELA
ncbi:MAG: polymerase III catalytic subunit, DnaE type protein [Candidatus Moranbacteria bacterium GW2011_GWC2_37_73]|nr:MAG: polymerase III catalytic subunit, DnaE type protein [Parcubacteria group bacterium GW2011_GWC1_36_108]KKQ39825.1 MAG: polymerase III catalytic subunit, DnaE type protein [Candidatus Moranbacteria bacterium GW2011_GWC2_37_73]HAR99873.1 DNA polymerase III subunit alpha [Candidatus Moranbacteria bacterium]HBI50574.1 DNA polymerase III subunit alpha [Candidatus Moranbacteria bacterium]HBU11099.1 DNA polymerase III subunit alpha [Candidatus Moranbacteria bacterium]